MPWTLRSRLTVLLVAVVGLAGCTGPSHDQAKPDQLPAATELLATSAAAMRDVQTTHFLLDVRGTIEGLAIHKAEGVLTRAGNAKGTATIDQFGATVEVEFVIVDRKVHLKGPTGGFQEVPQALAASVYDPSAILDPDRGVSKLLAAIKDAHTEAKESVGGQDAYRVAVTPAPGTLQALIPGASDQLTGKLWLAVDTKRLLKGEFTVPATGSTTSGAITITFSDFNAPVTISAP
jgi:lipoprotein LprG